MQGQHQQLTATSRFLEEAGSSLDEVATFAFARHLVTEIGVASVPGSSFYRDPASGSRQVRFCFCKKDETLDAAAERLAGLKT